MSASSKRKLGGGLRQYPPTNFKGQKRKFAIGPAAIALLIVLWFWCLARWGVNILPIACASSGTPPGVSKTYTTNFPLTEDPISEDGNWMNGQAIGLDWTNVRTTPGLAFGSDQGAASYDDSISVLTGSWRPDQTAQATVHSIHQNDNLYQELELLLRFSISPHSSRGYEISFKCSKTSVAYAQIVRWNGTRGDFASLNLLSGAQYGVTEGDVIKATVVGNVITGYINGIQVIQATDGTFSTGNPGIGFYAATANTNSDYGFTSFTASDRSAAAPSTLSASMH